MMIQRAAQAISAYFVAQGMIGREDNEISAFALECWLSSLLHFALLSITAYLLGLLAPAICFQLVFSTLKRRVGGCHAGSHFSCISGSILMALVLCYGAKSLPPGLAFPVICLDLVLVAALVLRKAPVMHPHNPKTERELQTCRHLAVQTAGLECAGVFFCYWLLPASLTPIMVAGSLGGAAAALSLLPPVPSSLGEGGDARESSDDKGSQEHAEFD